MMTDSKEKARDQRLSSIVAKAQQDRVKRENGYRARALKMYPWICGRCAREFDNKNLNELTVHHRDHDHDNNAEDGSNWELLCLYCHDNEHARYTDGSVIARGLGGEADKPADTTHQPFSDLAALLKKS